MKIWCVYGEKEQWSSGEVVFVHDTLKAFTSLAAAQSYLEQMKVKYYHPAQSLRKYDFFDIEDVEFSDEK